MNIVVKLLVALLVLGANVVAAQAADAIETRRVTFAKGATSTQIKSSIKGAQTIDYTLRAKAGQTMKVEMKTSNKSAYFNVLPPGSNDAALFIGSTSGDSFAGTLPADGVYKIRVFLMRSAARREETARFTLSVAITGG